MANKSNKSIKQLLSNLDDRQRKTLLLVLAKLQSGASVERDDVGLLGTTLTGFNHTQTHEYFKITRKMLYNWVDAGCPRKQDQSYDVYEVHRWLINREKQKLELLKNKDLTDRKIKQEDLKIKQARRRKMEETVIDIEKHRMVLASRIATLARYIKETGRKNLYHFANKNINELQGDWDDFAKGCMNAYLEGSKSIDL